MKIAKQARAHRPSLPTIRFNRDVECRARELRLIHQMARNTSTENPRLAKVIARQRHCLRQTLGEVRRYARRIARLSPPERQAIRQLQDSPFYVGLGAASALQRDYPDSRHRDDLDWLFDDAEAGDA